jgi:hypothetical protein
MKQIWVLALTAVMMLSCSITAHAGSVYLDYALNNSVENSWAGNPNPTSSGFLVGVEAPIDNWKIAFDYFSGQDKQNTAKICDDAYYTVKGGYALINNHQTRIDLTLGYYDRTFDNLMGSNGEAYSYLIGLDTLFNVTPRSAFGFDFGYGISGKDKYNAVQYDLKPMLLYILRYNYFFAENLGFDIAYRGVQLTDKANNKANTTGFSAGILYRF